jgi:hypothetical protein
MLMIVELPVEIAGFVPITRNSSNSYREVLRVSDGADPNIAVLMTKKKIVM